MLEGPWPSVDVRVVAIFVWLICSIMVPEQDNHSNSSSSSSSMMSMNMGNNL